MGQPKGIPAQLLHRLWLYVNFDCNLACSYCVSGSEPHVRRPRMEPTTFRALVDEAAALGFSQLAITGGEPFLHPDILPMLEYASSRLDTLVLTNATLMADSRLAGLARLSGSRLAVQVSLDAAEPRLNDLHRGHGSWERAVAGLRLLLEWGFGVTVRATVMEQTEDDLAELHRFVRGLGVAEQQLYSVPVARGGRSRAGVEIPPADLLPEPTLARDGLYWHPLKVEPSQAIAREILPLGRALNRLARRVSEVLPSSPPRGYR